MRKIILTLIITAAMTTGAFAFDYQFDRYQRQQQQYQQEQLNLQRQQLQEQRRYNFQQQQNDFRQQMQQPYNYNVPQNNIMDSFLEGQRKAQEMELRRQQLEYYRRMNQ